MRKLMWFTIGFAVACALSAYFEATYLPLVGVIMLALGVILLLMCRYFRSLRIFAVLLLSFSIGIGWFHLFDDVFLLPAKSLDGKSKYAEFEVADYSYSTDYGSAVSAGFVTDNKKFNVLLYMNDTFVLKPGDHINGTFRFRYTSKGANDEPTYHRSEGIYMLAYQAGEISVINGSYEPEHIPAQIRHMLVQTIEKIFPLDTYGFAKALLIGDRADIDYETNTAFRISGISHIIAVSGLHASILFGIVYLFSGRKKQLLCIFGFPLLLLFAAVTGFTPSVTRACIMQALVLLALLMKREYDAPTALAVSALIMLAVNPMVIVSISFQLSMGCMIGIFLFSDRIYRWIMDDRRLGKVKRRCIIGKLSRWFAVSISVSLGASIATTPLVAYYFGAVSLVGLFTNILIVWIISYIFYGIMLSCAVSAVSLTAGRIAAMLTVHPIRFVISTAKTIAKFPLSAVYTQSVYIVIWLVFVYIFLLVFLTLKKKPVLLFSCISNICLCVALLASWMEPLTDDCRVTVLDVGQGQSILLQSRGKSYLVDCGGTSPAKSADIAADTLLSQGIYRLDGIIVTHFDEDHAGGIPYLLTRIPADNVYLPDISDEEGICESINELCKSSATVVSSDFSLQCDASTVTVFGPESYNLGNESSLCVLFQTEKCDILITGDRGSLGEKLLLHRALLPDLEVLIAGHHGSASSTGNELLSATMPEYVLISVGDNSYGHPAQSLLERLRILGCKVYRTDLYGTIVYRG